MLFIMYIKKIKICIKIVRIRIEKTQKGRKNRGL